MLAALDRRHIRLLVATQLRTALGGRMGLIALGIFVGLGLLIAWVVTEPLSFGEAMVTTLEAAGPAAAGAPGHGLQLEFADILRPLVAWWVDADQLSPLVDHLLIARPVILSAYVVVLMGFVPLATCLLAFNQTAGDIRSKSFRYLLVRTARPNIFLARFIAAWVFVTLVGLAVLASATLFMGLRFPVFPATDLAAWGLSCAFALSLLCLPYVALLAWLSAALASPRAAWLIGVLATVGSYTAINIIQGQADAGPWLDRFTPWGWKYDLLHPDASPFALAVLAMVAFAGLFLAFGLARFARRDM